MKRLYVLVGLLLCTTAMPMAKQIYVSPNGNDQNSGSNRQNPIESLDYAINLADAGDEIILLNGVYLNPLIVNKSGSPSAPIVIRADNPRSAVIRPTRFFKDGIRIVGQSHIVIDGVDIDGQHYGEQGNLAHFASIRNSSNIVIRDGHFSYARGWHGIQILNSSYITLEDSQLDWVGMYDHPTKRSSAYGDILVIEDVNSHHILVQRNEFRHGGHDLIRINGTHSIFQDNYLNNSYEDLVGPGAGKRASSQLGEHNIFQRNYLTGAGVSSDKPNNPLHKVEGKYNLARFNVFADGINEGIVSEAGTWSKFAYNARIFHNTFYNLGGPSWRMRMYDGGEMAGSAVFQNNLLVNTRKQTLGKLTRGDVVFVMREAAQGPTANSKVISNVISPAKGAHPQAIIDGFGGRLDIDTLENQYADLFMQNRFQSEIDFSTSTPSRYLDFKTNKDAAAVDSGTYLTRTTRSNSSRHIHVSDSLFFTDGLGLIPGDEIMLEGRNGTLRVVEVDHQLNQLTVNESISYSEGQGVTLVYSGSRPDAGAFEYSVTRPNPPRIIVLN